MDTQGKTTSRTRLVVIIGPIAAGKSTVAGLLTEQLTTAGLAVACAELDDVADMLHPPRGQPRRWDEAHPAHGALVRGMLETTADVVIAVGPIYTREEADALMDHVPRGTSTQRVLLLASYDSALDRVARQRRRGGSRNPEFLRAMYDRFESLVPQLDACDLTFDTGEVIAEEIARQITAHVLGPDD